MKLISLNIWGGKLWNDLVILLEYHAADTDIFCFQEVTSCKEHREIAELGMAADSLLGRAYHTNTMRLLPMVLRKTVVRGKRLLSYHQELYKPLFSIRSVPFIIYTVFGLQKIKATYLAELSSQIKSTKSWRAIPCHKYFAAT